MGLPWLVNPRRRNYASSNTKLRCCCCPALSALNSYINPVERRIRDFETLACAHVPGINLLFDNAA